MDMAAVAGSLPGEEAPKSFHARKQVLGMKTETWTHPYLRCSQCQGPAEATDAETPEGLERTCRYPKGCQGPKTYRINRMTPPSPHGALYRQQAPTGRGLAGDGGLKGRRA